MTRSDVLDSIRYYLNMTKQPTHWLMFYAGKLYGQMTRQQIRDLTLCNRELYDGGYLFNPVDHTWWRCDLTPVITEHVAPELRLQALLVT